MVVDYVGVEDQGEGDVDGVGDPDDLPGGEEALGLVHGGTAGSILLGLLQPGPGRPGVSGGEVLDYIGHDEMAGDEEVESEA